MYDIKYFNRERRRAEEKALFGSDTVKVPQHFQRAMAFAFSQYNPYFHPLSEHAVFGPIFSLQTVEVVVKDIKLDDGLPPLPGNRQGIQNW